MFSRTISQILKKLIQQYAVVTITGPRQSGKTTLVKKFFTKKPYFNLEEPDTRDRIIADPKGFFNDLPDGAVLDEIQRAPELLSYVQVIVDESKKSGMFILTGSHQLQLHQAISQSLAGRSALLELLPLSINELQQAGISISNNSYLYKGFYPAIYDRNLDPTTHYRNYLKTYVERDVRQLINIRDLDAFHRFLQLSVGRIGNVLNFESLVNDTGVSNNTIKNWFSILDASYITLRLQPYYENFGKRVLKSPKLYFIDVGLVSYLLGIKEERQLTHERLRGALFENLILLELIKFQYNQGQDANLFYFRDNHGNEVDILIKERDYLIPIEVKASATFHPSMLKNLDFYKHLVGERMPCGCLIYGGEESYKLRNVHVLSYKDATNIYKIIKKQVD